MAPQPHSNVQGTAADGSAEGQNLDPDLDDADTQQLKSFLAVAHEMSHQADKNEHAVSSEATPVRAASSSDSFLHNLFRLPESDGYFPLTSVYDFCTTAQQNLATELVVQDSLYDSDTTVSY